MGIANSQKIGISPGFPMEPEVFIGMEVDDSVDRVVNP